MKIHKGKKARAGNVRDGSTQGATVKTKARVVPTFYELLDLVTFWVEVYVLMQRDRFINDEPINYDSERTIWSRLLQIRAAINDDGKFQQAVKYGCIRARLLTQFHKRPEVNDRLWLIFVNGNDQQRRAAALIMKHFRDGNVSAVKDKILGSILERIESEIATMEGIPREVQAHIQK